MIRYLTREIAGWAMVLLGLYIFAITLSGLLGPEPPIFEAPFLTTIGVFVFRGGIHLLKVAVAARVCLQAQQDVVKEQSTAKRKSRNEGPWDW